MTTLETGAINWQERKPPKKFEFGQGEELVGILTNHDRGTVRDKRTGAAKPVNRWVVQPVEDFATNKFGDPVFFHGTVQLDSMLRPSDVGHFVRIVSTGEDKEAGRQGNAMKLFTVNVSEGTAPGWASNGTPIGDDDLPPDSYMA